MRFKKVVTILIGAGRADGGASIAGRKRAALVMLVLLMAGAPGRAADVPSAFRDEVRGDHDRQSLDSLDFILTLGLSAQQARAILPVHAEACRLHLERYAQLAEIQPREIEAYRAFLMEDVRNRGFSPEVERTTSRVHHEAIESREAFAEALNGLSERVNRVLHPRQQRAATAYKAGRQAVFAAFATEKDWRDAQRRAERRARHGRGRRPQDDPALEHARTQLREIQDALHAHQNAISKYLLTPAAAESLYALARANPPAVVYQAVRCWRYGTPSYPLPLCEQHREVIRNLSRDINHWNLTNGMYFSRDQLAALIQLADRLEGLRRVQREARPREKLHPVAFDRRIVELELAAESVLNPGQIEVLRDYKPCLIPPKDLKNPVRVGQANDNSGPARWLEHTRTVGAEPRVERLIDRLIEREIEHLGPLTDSEKAARRALLRETVQTAAGMSDVEFALNKDDMVASIARPDRKGELSVQIDDMRRDRLQPGRTSRFLLSQSMANVLRVRYQQLVQGAPDAKRASRASGSSGADCAKSCGH